MSQQSYYVLEIHYVNRPPATLTFNAPRVVIGRDAGDVVLSDPESSATHAELEFQNGQLVVRDLGSSNGTWKGERTLPQFALSVGDVFRCGHTKLRVAQIVGGQVVASGGTVMGDPKMLAELKRQQAGGAPSSREGGSGGLVAIIAVVAVVVIAGGGVGAWWLLRSDDPKPEVAAQTVDAEPEPEVDTPPATDVPPVVADAPVVEKDMGELYKQVGAATVVVRVPGSVGSGSIIDPKGLILTNHHVIEGGERDGLRIKAHVTLGKYSEDLQAFEPSEEKLEAYVVKIDEDHDLALIQLIDAPPDLPSLKLSEKQPYPGQKVAAVGHAGAGLLWAIKGGEVSSTGKLAGHTDLQLEDAEGFRKDALARAKQQMDKKGRVVQSTAKILPGDSGGPLVSLSGQIVGVNAFGRIDRATNQWLSFHVHQAEVALFLAEIPEHPLDFIPDPWHLVDATPNGADIDLDGTLETIVASPDPGQGGKTAYYLDLDQDSLRSGQAPQSWDELTDKDTRKFDAELAVLRDSGSNHFWYDTDNDGRFDVYMLDSTGDGKVDVAYRVSKEGVATSDTSAIVENGLDAKLFDSSIARDRFKRIGPVAFPGAVEQGEGHSATPAANDTIGTLTASDSDGDGTSDTFVESSFFSRRVFFDADQNVGGNGGTYTLARDIEHGRADLEAAVLVQTPFLWAWYDTDEDGKFDLLLEGRAQSSSVTAAYKVSASGRAAGEIKGYEGRLVLRSDLVPADAVARWKQSLAAEFRGAWVGTDAGVGSFPPLSVSPTARVEVSDRGGLTNAVAMVTEYGNDLVLVDLNTDTAPDQSATEVAKLVAQGKFDAEFAMLTVGEHRWSFYDTDGVDGFDVVMSGRKHVEAAYRVTETGEVEPIDGSNGSLVRWGTFTKKGLRKKFERVAPTLFPSQATE